MGLNWEEGVWRSAEVGPTDARIAVASEWAPIWEYEELALRDPEGVYGDLLPALRRADLRIVNVECALAPPDAAPAVKDGPNLRGEPRAVAGLTAVPFHVACLANNHVFDYGAESLRRTMDLLRDSRLDTVGAGVTEEEATAPLVAAAGDARVGIVNFSEGEDCTAARGGPGVFGWDVGLVVEKVKGLRAEADVVLVIFHGGREHVPVPPPYVVEALRRIARAGADAVVAHHPHVPQGVEIHEGVPIVYGQGNFVFLKQTDLFYRRAGYLAELELADRRLAGLRLVPYVLGERGLQEMQGNLWRWFLDRLRRASEPLAEAAAVCAAREAFIDRVGDEGTIGVMHRNLCEDPPRRAARLRNLFATPAHQELWIAAMTRVIEGRTGTAPGWAGELVREWFTLTMEEAERLAG